MAVAKRLLRFMLLRGSILCGQELLGHIGIQSARVTRASRIRFARCCLAAAPQREHSRARDILQERSKVNGPLRGGGGLTIASTSAAAPNTDVLLINAGI